MDYIFGCDTFCRWSDALRLREKFITIKLILVLYFKARLIILSTIKLLLGRIDFCFESQTLFPVKMGHFLTLFYFN